jgi:hypothetical protein
MTTRRTATSAASLPTTSGAIFPLLGLIDIAFLGVVTAITARVISAVLAVAAFFADAPASMMAVEAFVIAATLIAVVLLRRGPWLQGA